MKQLVSVMLCVLLFSAALSGCGNQTEPAFDAWMEADEARVSYLGPEGTYTEEAAQFFFPTGDNP